MNVVCYTEVIEGAIFVVTHRSALVTLPLKVVSEGTQLHKSTSIICFIVY